MKKLVLAAVLAAAVAAPYSPASAGPPATGPDGVLCGFASVTDPGTEGGDVQTGELDGGPIIGTGTLTCTIQVGQSTHAGSDAASASATGGPVVVLPPTVVSYVSPADVPVYLCTQWTDASGTYYWHDGEDTGEDGHWTTDPNKPCSLATSASSGDVTDPIFDALDGAFGAVNQVLIDHVDPKVCPVLAEHFPPEGDIPDVWDCPPYGP